MARAVKDKWKKLDENTQKWAKRLTAAATIIGVLAGGTAWFIRTLDGAITEKIENQTSILQQEVKQISAEREATAKQTDLQLTRLELMMLIQTDPENVLEIEKVAKRYFVDLEGNTYMSGEFTKWAKQYGGNMEFVIK